jgi:predicted DCC family thiol-disulfide oxidoreductase YuxK
MTSRIDLVSGEHGRAGGFPLEQSDARRAPRLAAPLRIGREILAAVGRVWSAIWFQDSTTSPLEIIRIGLGAAVLFHFGTGTPYLFDFWGDTGWMPPEVAQAYIAGPWMQSVFYYFTAPWQWIAFHALFLFCCAAFTVGWRTSWVKWIVLTGLISYDHRNLTIVYGADSIIACVIFILCLAPVGRAMSLDRVRAVRAAKRGNLEATVPAYTSPWAGACIRLVQIQMAVLFFYSATDKLRIEEWWNGDAIWLALTTYEFYHPTLLHLLARHYWLVNLSTYATLLIELAFPFLIWQRRTRPYLLAAAIVLHLLFGVLLRLIYFSFAMTIGHLSFLYPDWLHRLGAWWKRKMGSIEMIYDGDCGFCVRSMAWLLAFDGLGQIKVRDFRRNPSALVSDAQMEKALYTVLPDGRGLPGFEAYRYVVARVPGLWWLVPLFYVPVLSRLLGQPIYNWVAANRGRLSAMMVSKKWRGRSLYTVASLFLAWHTVSTMLAPLPDKNAIVHAFRTVFQPYLTLTGTDTTWDFFSPLSSSYEFRYVIEDAAGNQHTFTPIADVSWLTPNHRWDERIFATLISTPTLIGGYFANEFCREHAALKPVAVTMLYLEEKEFWPQDYFLGKQRTTDPANYNLYPLLRAGCPQP